MNLDTKKRKPDLCNPTLVRFSMILVYQHRDYMSNNEEENYEI